MCNTTEQNAYAFGLGPDNQQPSSGNIVRGNRFIDGYVGMVLWGVGVPAVDGEPAVITNPQSSDNLIRHNTAQGNFLVDMSEAFWYESTWEFFLVDGADCENTWKKNMFDTQFGPDNCIGEPVLLDNEDVCALDEEHD
jgi:hypothetical protein